MIMDKEQLTYAEAMKELDSIVAKLQSPDCDVDQLCDYTRRATVLLKFCREKLTKTDAELEELLKEL